MSIDIVPHYHALCGKSFYMAMLLTLRNGGRYKTDKLWCRYVVASAMNMMCVIEWVGVVKLWSGSIIFQKSGQR